MSDNDSPRHHPQAPFDDVKLISDQERADIWQTLIDNPPPRHPSHGPEKKLTASQRRFDADFTRHAMPKLLAIVVGYAPMVRLEVYSFDEAWQAIWRAALVWGSAHLSDEAQSDLDGWISSELLMHIDDPLPEELVTPERLRLLTGES